MAHIHEPPIRDVLITYLQSQSNDITIDDVMAYLYTLQKITLGRDEIKAGNFYTDEKVEAIFEKWLN